MRYLIIERDAVALKAVSGAFGFKDDVGGIQKFCYWVWNCSS